MTAKNEHKRKEWEARTRAQLDKLESEIEKLKAKGKELSEDARSRHQERISSLEKKRDLANEKLQELQNGSSEAWEEIKNGSQSIWDDFSSAVAGARDAFHKE